jgi:hypothetical protein
MGKAEGYPMAGCSPFTLPRSTPPDLLLRMLLGVLAQGAKAEEDCQVFCMANNAIVKFFVVDAHRKKLFRTPGQR